MPRLQCTLILPLNFRIRFLLQHADTFLFVCTSGSIHRQLTSALALLASSLEISVSGLHKTFSYRIHEPPPGEIDQPLLMAEALLEMR